LATLPHGQPVGLVENGFSAMKHTFGVDDNVLPTFYPGNLLRWLVSEGYTWEQLLQGSELTADIFSDENARISFRQHKPLILNALELTQNPHLGLQFGQQLTITSLGIVGYAALSSETVATALDVVTRYFKIRAPLFSLSLRPQGDYFELSIEEALDFGPIRQFMFESMLSCIDQLFVMLLGDEPPDLDVSITYAEPHNWQQHQQQQAQVGEGGEGRPHQIA